MEFLMLLHRFQMASSMSWRTSLEQTTEKVSRFTMMEWMSEALGLDGTPVEKVPHPHTFLDIHQGEF